MRDVHILQDSAAHFIAEQPPSGYGMALWWTLIVVVVSIAFFRRGEWKGALSMFIPVALFLGLFLFIGRPTYRCDLDRGTGQVTSEKISHGKVAEQKEVNLRDISSAEMEFNRGSRRVVLVGKQGQLFYPLGEENIQNEPSQYKVLLAFRKALGQDPQLTDRDRGVSQ